MSKYDEIINCDSYAMYYGMKNQQKIFYSEPIQNIFSV